MNSRIYQILVHLLFLSKFLRYEISTWTEFKLQVIFSIVVAIEINFKLEPIESLMYLLTGLLVAYASSW